jgi:hypothetical protein
MGVIKGETPITTLTTRQAIREGGANRNAGRTVRITTRGKVPPDQELGCIDQMLREEMIGNIKRKGNNEGGRLERRRGITKGAMKNVKKWTNRFWRRVIAIV